MRTFRIITCVLCALFAAATTASAAELKVQIEGVRSSKGVLMMGLYDNVKGYDLALTVYDTPDGFVRDKGRLVGTALRANTGSVTATFSDLPKGQYAVIVFHDENADGRTDKNFLGVPTEGLGFSNGASISLAAPEFDDAKITVDQPSKDIKIKLAY